MTRVLRACMATVLMAVVLVPAGTASAVVVPVLARGTMMNGDVPIAGASVTIFPLDPADTTSRTQLVSVGSTNVDSDGTWSVRANPTDAMIALAAQNDGWVNFMAYMVKHNADGNGNAYVQVKDFSRLIPGFTTSSLDSRPDTTTYGTVAGENAGMDISLSPSDPGTMTLADPAGVQPDVPVSCYKLDTVESSHSVLDPVNEVHAVGDMNNEATYGVNADTTVGAGIDGIIPDTPFAYSGSVHVSNSGGIVAEKDGGKSYGGDLGRVVDGQFGWHKDKMQCGPSSVVHQFYNEVATIFYGGIALENQDLLPTLDHHCFKYPFDQQFTWPAFSKITHSSVKGQTFHLGFKVFGVGFDTTSGFSTSVTKSWQFGGDPNGGTLCGNNNAPLLAGRTYAGFV